MNFKQFTAHIEESEKLMKDSIGEIEEAFVSTGKQIFNLKLDAGGLKIKIDDSSRELATLRPFWAKNTNSLVGLMESVRRQAVILNQSTNVILEKFSEERIPIEVAKRFKGGKAPTSCQMVTDIVILRLKSLLEKFKKLDCKSLINFELRTKIDKHEFTLSLYSYRSANRIEIEWGSISSTHLSYRIDDVVLFLSLFDRIEAVTNQYLAFLSHTSELPEYSEETN